MMNRYRGTAIGQDLRWKSKQAKMLKEMNAPAILTTKVCCFFIFLIFSLRNDVPTFFS